MNAESIEDSPFTQGDTYQGMPVPRAHGTLTVAERALSVFAAVPSEEALRDLAKLSETITEITNEAGKDQCHARRMVLKNTRLEIARTGEVGREDAVQTSKAIIAIQKSRIGLVQPEENRLQAIQDAWDAKIEIEKEAKILAEIARVAEIQRRIDGIRSWPINASNQPSMLVAQMLANAQAYRIEPEVFEEHTETANAVLAASTAALSGLLAERKAFEAAQLQAEEDRKELAKLRADQLERDRLAREAQAKADADAKLERDRLEAIAKAEAARQTEASRLERERIAREEAEIKAKRERTAAILERIEELRGNQMLTATSGSQLISEHFSDLEKIAVDASFEEFEEKARTTKDAGLLRLHALYDAALEHEAEQARLKAEREENERIARERQEELDRQVENQRRAFAAEEARIAAERAKFEAEQEAARKAAEPKPEPVQTATPVKVRTVERPTSAQIVACVAEHYKVSPEMAAKWIRHAKIELETQTGVAA